jgi:alpha-L-fucosidase 2
MKKTLNTRGDGGTGWSKAWKINFWARLRDGNHSHKLLEELLKESTLTNLFDTHPPFQIDGNFGATAGMTEMLVQSQGEFIEILPALPDTWSAGSFAGIKARGNFELAARWENGKITSLEITSNSGNDCAIKIDDRTIRFATIPGAVYQIK